MVDMTEAGQADNPNKATIAIITDIARAKGHLRSDGSVNRGKLAEAIGMSSRGLEATFSGSQPTADTLLRVARYGGVNPLHLYVAMGWLADEDITRYRASLRLEDAVRTTLGDDDISSEEEAEMVELVRDIAALRDRWMERSAHRRDPVSASR